jgi:carboxyl-terminal processing protease
MTDKSKRILIILIGSVALVFLLAFIAIGAFILGRNSADVEEQNMTVIVDEVASAIEKELSETAPASSPVSAPTSVQDSEGDQDPTSQPPAQSSDTTAAEVDSSRQTGDVTTQEEIEERVPVDLDSINGELLLEVWEIINREFDGSLPSSSDITYQSISASMELLEDQYSRFLPPEIAERSRIQIQGGYEGIGAYVDLTEDGNLLIVRPIDGQPADEAGLLGGDIVIRVDGSSITGMPLHEIVALVTGPKGTEVTLTVFREETGETIEFTIIRQRIDFPLVTSEMLEDNIGYVRLTSFSSGADKQLIAAIKELLDGEPVGLILDLRDNPGGLLAESIEISDLFLPEGIVAYQRDSQGNERIFESDDGDLAETIPLVVLVNEGSASGSEIVAGAINDLERGVLIGARTLGKGSVQQSYTLSDGSELRNWHGRYRT